MNALQRLEEWQAKDPRNRRASIDFQDDYLHVQLNDKENRESSFRSSGLHSEDWTFEETIIKAIENWEARYGEE